MFKNYEKELDLEKSDSEDSEDRAIRTNYGIDELVGIFSVNRAEWIVSEYAIYMSKSTNCPLYSTFGVESIRHILNETGMRICFVSGIKAASLFKDVVSKYDTSLKVIVSYDRMDEVTVEEYRKRGVEVHFYEDIVNDKTLGTKNLDNKERINTFNSGDAYSNNTIHTIGSGDAYNDNDGITCRSYKNKDIPLIKGCDIATVCYTSGTSGQPKGVLLTHLNFLSTVLGFISGKVENGTFKMHQKDTYLSYLPLAYVMERVCISMVIANGARIAFFRGNPKILQQDMKIIKPSFLVGVPRVFNVFKEKIEEQIAKKPFLIRMLVNAAIRYKIRKQKDGIYESKFLDWLIFRKVMNEFGGGIRAALNGSAPLAGDVTEYLQAVLGMRIFQGYGQTEGTAANILMTMDDRGNVRVGIPFPTTLVKVRIADEDVHEEEDKNVIRSKPAYTSIANHIVITKTSKGEKREDNSVGIIQKMREDVRSELNMGTYSGVNTRSVQENTVDPMNRVIGSEVTGAGVAKGFPINYTVLRGDASPLPLRGEIMLRGNNITQGYYKRKDLNKEMFEDGWLRTGDIGCIEDGVFKVVGRIKEIFKTSLGEYIIPEKIENVLKGGVINDLLVTGKSHGDYIVAIVVCKNRAINDEEVFRKVLEAGDNAFKRGILTRFEIPKRIFVLRDDFETFGGMLTPTMKKKRSRIEMYFADEIQRLYNTKN